MKLQLWRWIPARRSVCLIGLLVGIIFLELAASAMGNEGKNPSGKPVVGLKRMAASGAPPASKASAAKEPGRPSPMPAAAAGQAGSATRAHISEAYGKLPMSFEANQGQRDARVKFLARGRGYNLFLTPTEAVLALQQSKSKGRNEDAAVSSRPSARGNSKIENGIPQSGTRVPSPESPALAVLRMNLVGANPASQIAGLEELPGRSNYFIGNDPKKWRTNVPNYAKVRYKAIYPGVDLVYYGNQRHLEYDFVVAPGADPKAIRLGFETGNSKLETGDSKLEIRNSKFAPTLRIDADGDLVVSIEGGELRFQKPIVYQVQSTVDSRELKGTHDGRLSPEAVGNSEFTIQNSEFVEGRYVLTATNEIRFEVPAYDRRRPLIIDPVLTYSTYLGGSEQEYANSIAVDSAGNAYVTGHTYSTDFPSALNRKSDGADVFVAKLNASGSAIVYSTYLGGSGDDIGHAIAVDSGGNAWLAGETKSSNFPTLNPVQSSCGGCTLSFPDAIVAELGPMGILAFSTYLGGTTGQQRGYGIAVDSSGDAYVVGGTTANDFPTTVGAHDRTCGLTNTCSPGTEIEQNEEDAFVTEISPAGSLVYSTYVGGEFRDEGRAIAVDSSGCSYITGLTYSTQFPLGNPYQGVKKGHFDAFVTKLNAAGSELVYSTYLGGPGYDAGYAIAVDSSGNAYVSGTTESPDFPTQNPLPAPSDVSQGGANAFVTKIDTTKTYDASLIYSTYLGGSGNDQAYGIALDVASGNVYVTGQTTSSDFPLASPIQSSLGGGLCEGACPDAFVTKLDATGSTLTFSTYLGGDGEDYGNGIAVDSLGSAYVTGYTGALDFPTTAGVFQPACALNTDGYCSGDAFVAKISPEDISKVLLTPTSLDFGEIALTSSALPEVVTLRNVGSAPLSITSIEASPTDFRIQTNTCGSGLAGGGSCTFSVYFSPSASGLISGTITITDNAADSPHVVTLTGTGVYSGVQLSVPSLDFGNQDVGSTSAPPQQITLTNSGALLNITSVVLTGANAADFAISADTCTGASLAPSGSCTIDVTFTPTAGGVRTGTLTIYDNAPFSPRMVILTGTGIPPNPVPLILQPLVPASTPPAPGGLGFTLTVNGTGFVSASVVKWNGSPKATTVASSTQLTATILASDIAAAGTASVTVFNPGPGGGTSNTVFFPITNPTTAILLTRTDSLTGAGPVALATGDFDGDGKLDLATTNYDAGTISILLGKGGGTFQKTEVDIPTLSYPTALTVGDFNRDGYLDLAVAGDRGDGCGGVMIHLGDGAGGFASSQTYALSCGQMPYGIVAADFNGDGYLDLATANYYNTISILLGNVDGTFQKTEVDIPTLYYPTASTVGDFNGDGYLDLAVAGDSCYGEGCGAVMIHLGDGAGGFPSGGGTYYVGTGAYPYGIVTADFNGDGKLDLPTANSDDWTISILLGNGDGTFQPRVDYDTGAYPSSVTTGDFNGDGKLDLATANYDDWTVSILLGKGDGTFQPRVDYATGAYPSSVTTGDFNGDGRLDLASANYDDWTVSILLQTPAVTLSSASLTLGSQPFNILSPAQTLTLTNSGSGLLRITSIVASGDLDFTQTNDCGTAVAGEKFCTISVTFTPTTLAGRAGTLTITDNASGSPRTVNLSGTGIPAPTTTSINAPTVTYNSNGSVTVTVTSAAGTVTGDVSLTVDSGAPVTQRLSGGSATFTLTSPAAGSHTLNVTYAVQGNFAASSGTGTLTVNKASLTVTAADASRTYGAANPAFTGTITGIQNADNITATYATSATVTSSGGTYTIVPTLVDPTGKLGNYTVASNNGTLTVTKASLTVTAADASRTYGAANPAFTGTITGIQNADNITATYATSATVTSAGGTYTIVPTLVDPTGKLGNYTVASNNGTLTVTRVSLTVTAADASRTYGAANPAFTGSYSGFVNGETSGVLTGTLSCTSGATATSAVSGSPYPITCSGLTSTNYGISYVTGQLTVIKATPAFSSLMASQTILYGTPSITIAGKIAAGSVIPPTGESVTITISGGSHTASIGGNGLFTAAFDTHAIPASLTAYTITYSYAGDGNFNSAADASTSLTVTAPAVSLSSASVILGDEAVGTASAARVLTLANTGTADLAITSIVAAGDFTQTNTCGTSVATGARCIILVRFNPAATGTRSGTLTITDSASDSPQVIALSGTGTAPVVSLSVEVLTFQHNINIDCPPKTVALTNTGTGPLAITGIVATGDFTQTNTCGTSLAAGASCDISVIFKPTAEGLVAGAVTITDNAADSPQIVALAGTGLPPCLLITSAQTATVVRGMDSTAFTISDPKPSCHTSAIGLACQRTGPVGCLFNPQTIPPSGSSALTLRNLKALAADALNFRVTGTSGRDTTALDLVVLVSDFSFSTSPASVTLEAGQTASYSLAIAPSNRLTGRVQLSCSGAPAGATCAVTPSAVTLDGSKPGQANVQVTTTARALASPGGGDGRYGRPGGSPLLWLLALVGLAALLAVWRLRALKPAPTLALAGMLLLILVWAACGGGGGFVSTTGPSGTPAGSYSLKITGTYTSASPESAERLSHEATLTLTVN